MLYSPLCPWSLAPGVGVTKWFPMQSREVHGIFHREKRLVCLPRFLFTTLLLKLSNCSEQNNKDAAVNKR